MNLEHFKKMAHSPLRNYALPGVTSYLIGERAKNGSMMRLFHSDRVQVMAVTPHSHRYDFEAHVIQGQVRNRIWRLDINGDPYRIIELEYLGRPGNYKKTDGSVDQWSFADKDYVRGDSYGMAYNQVHSIYFARDTWVLVAEGPTVASTSFIIEPVVDGETIETSKTESWMFQH